MQENKKLGSRSTEVSAEHARSQSKKSSLDQLSCSFLFERSEFLIATCKKKKTDSLCVWLFG